jgi:hypothetical protein
MSKTGYSEKSFGIYVFNKGTNPRSSDKEIDSAFRGPIPDPTIPSGYKKSLKF